MVLKVIYLDYDDVIKEKNQIGVLGFFDGLHIAHMELIKKGVELKKQYQQQLTVFTFEQNIRKYLNNEPFYYLTSIKDKQEILSDIGVDILYVFKISRPFIGLSPTDFIEKYLIHMSHLVVGFDFTYGYRSIGNVELLKSYNQFETHVLSEISYQGEKIGSSKIREFLDHGQMALANYLLGRNYNITGRVIHGRGVGKILGFPTANIDFTDYYLPKRGVYLTKVLILGETFYGVTNVGKKPTFKDQSISLETYIFDLDKDLYDTVIRIEFIEFMRDEIKYSNKEALIEQIEKDVLRAKNQLLRRIENEEVR